ncbi:MAG: TIGR00282 family metallophosphoesterase [bacterium]
MKKKFLKILFIGDIIGKPGRQAVSQLLPDLKKKLDIDFVIANVENAAGGFGVTPNIANELCELGINCLTSGNHIWDKKEIFDYLDKSNNILRPANYCNGVSGTGARVFEIKTGEKIGVINLAGLVFMTSLESPFYVALREIEKLKKETNIILIDFHAEATSEKIALGWFLDGKVSAIIGSHTHVQTADERILPQETAYITDAGMTGPFDSVIGSEKNIILKKFLTQIPIKYEVAKEDIKLCGVVVKIDAISGKSLEIKRIQIPLN